jgi:hypothetical protein
MNYEDDSRTAYEHNDMLNVEQSIQLRDRVIKMLKDIPEPRTIHNDPPIVSPFFGMKSSSDTLQVGANEWRHSRFGDDQGYVWSIRVNPPSSEKVTVTPAGEATITVARHYLLHDHRLLPGEYPVTRLVGLDKDKEVPVTTTDEHILEEGVRLAVDNLMRERGDASLPN